MPAATDRPSRTVVVVLTGLCVGLALMCAGLAWAWTHQRAEAECWRAAVESQLQPEGDCQTSAWAPPAPKV